MSTQGQIWIIVLLACLPVVFAVIIQWTTQKSPFAPYIQSHKGLAAPFFVPISVIFALFATFLTNDIWVRAQDRASEIERSLEGEISALRSLQRIAVSLKERGANIDASLKHYIEASNSHGWSAYRQHGSTAENDGLQSIVNAILNPSLSGSGSAIAQHQMLDIYRTVEHARAERAVLPSYEPDTYKWVGMIILGFLTQTAIAMVHVENSKAQAASLLLFSLAFIVVLVIVGVAERDVFRYTIGSSEMTVRLTP